MDPARQEVMMSVPGDELGQQLQIMLMRQLVAATDRTATALDRLTAANSDLGQRLTALEAANWAAQAADLHSRLELLEDGAQQRAGAVKLVSWLKDYAPWILGLLFVIWQFFERKPPTH